MGTANAAVFTKNLYFGLENDSEILKLQEFLTTEGLYSGPITGNFYTLTLNGVKAFQNKHSITPVGGFFGPLTRGKANTIIDSQLSNDESQTIIETGNPSSTPTTKTDSTQLQLSALLAQLELLQKQLNAQQQAIQGIQNAQANTTPTTPVVLPNNPQTIISTGTTPVPIITMVFNGLEIVGDKTMEIQANNWMDYVYKWNVSYPNNDYSQFKCSSYGDIEDTGTGSGQKFFRYTEAGTHLLKISCLNTNNNVVASKSVTITIKETPKPVTYACILYRIANGDDPSIHKYASIVLNKEFTTTAERDEWVIGKWNGSDFSPGWKPLIEAANDPNYDGRYGSVSGWWGKGYDCYEK